MDLRSLLNKLYRSQLPPTHKAYEPLTNEQAHEVNVQIYQTYCANLQECIRWHKEVFHVEPPTWAVDDLARARKAGWLATAKMLYEKEYGV